MSDQLIFPAIDNFSRIPADFRCYDILPDRRAPDRTHMDLDSIFFVDSPAGWAVSRTEDFQEPAHIDMFFILSGSVCHQTVFGKGRACAGQVMLVPSQLNRIIFLDEPSAHIYVRLDGDYKRFGISRLIVRNCPDIEEMEAYVGILRKRSLSPGMRNTVCRHNILENMTMLFHQELYPGAGNDSPEKINRLLDYLHRESVGRLSVSAVAGKCGMSLSKFRQFCLKNFAKSPGDLLDDVRMSRARALLVYSDLSIDLIAAELGYSSRFAFSKAFSRINHVSPGRFRRG